VIHSIKIYGEMQDSKKKKKKNFLPSVLQPELTDCT
jgi:hypothetical protein